MASYNISKEELIKLIVTRVNEKINSSSTCKPCSSSNHALIPLGVSNRHLHLTKETFHKLFGDETKFESDRPLYQPGEFASKHTVMVVGSKLRSIPGVRILGPLRKYDQVEISYTDSIYLGVNTPVVNSGNLSDAAPITLVGPKESLFLEKAAIIASRHIHMTDADASKLGVKAGDYCKVRIGGVKGTVFENVLIRTNDNWKLQIHLDTDDANAANVTNEQFVEFIGKM